MLIWKLKLLFIVGSHFLQILDAMIGLLCILPPGSETLALNALTYIFSSRVISKFWEAVQKQTKFCEKGFSLPDPEKASRELLRAYTIVYLGLKPQKNSMPKKASTLETSYRPNLVVELEPEGSLLPLSQDWLYNMVSQFFDDQIK